MMKTKYEVRSGKWKDVIEAEDLQNLKSKLRTRLIALPEGLQLGFFGDIEIGIQSINFILPRMTY